MLLLQKVLQQSNGYDCGVHVIANAKHSTRHIMLYGSPDGLPTLPDKEIKGFVKQYYTTNKLSYES